MPTSTPNTEQARLHLNRAIDLRIEGNNQESATELSKAIMIDPTLVGDEYVRTLAAVVTDLPAEAAIAKLRGSGRQPAKLAPTWTCSFCGTMDARGDTCPNCGAPRPATAPISAGSIAGDRKIETLSLSEMFLLNPAHKNFLQGKSRQLEPSSIFARGCMMIFMVPFILVGIGIILFTAVEWNNLLQISRSSVTAQAEVISRRTGSDSDGDDYYKVTYQFRVADRAFKNERSVNSSEYDRLKAGVRVPIVYAANNPTISYLQSENRNTLPLFLTLFGVCWNGIILSVIVAGLGARQKNQRLERDGVLLKGTIVEISGREDSDNDYIVKLKYAFRTPNDRELVKQESCTRNDLKRGKQKERLPLTGTPVAVLYANDSCFKVM